MAKPMHVGHSARSRHPVPRVLANVGFSATRRTCFEHEARVPETVFNASVSEPTMCSARSDAWAAPLDIVCALASRSSSIPAAGSTHPRHRNVAMLVIVARRRIVPQDVEARRRDGGFNARRLGRTNLRQSGKVRSTRSSPASTCSPGRWAIAVCGIAHFENDSIPRSRRVLAASLAAHITWPRTTRRSSRPATHFGGSRCEITLS
jgi:hypothetical protein